MAAPHRWLPSLPWAGQRLRGGWVVSRSGAGHAMTAGKVPGQACLLAALRCANIMLTNLMPSSPPRCSTRENGLAGLAGRRWR